MSLKKVIPTAAWLYNLIFSNVRKLSGENLLKFVCLRKASPFSHHKKKKKHILSKISMTNMNAFVIFSSQIEMGFFLPFLTYLWTSVFLKHMRVLCHCLKTNFRRMIFFFFVIIFLLTFPHSVSAGQITNYKLIFTPSISVHTR